MAELTAASRQHQEEASGLKSEARKAQDALELELKSVRLDLERKERRLETRSKKIEELQADCEQQRSRYEIAYKGQSSFSRNWVNLDTSMEDVQPPLRKVGQSMLKERSNESNIPSF